MDHRVTPIYILSGFLGSGKTTLLTRFISHWKQQGLKPAIVMNEIGEVNIDGYIAGQDVPTAEMLSGCICCSIRSDLSSELALLIQREQPDVIAIEATGVANPVEILDAIAEASLYMKVDLKQLITVVDAGHLLELHREQKGKTYRLMQEQIRAATLLILNKIDRIQDHEQAEIRQLLTRWNPYAPIVPASHCEVDVEALLVGRTADVVDATGQGSGSGVAQSSVLSAGSPAAASHSAARSRTATAAGSQWNSDADHHGQGGHDPHNDHQQDHEHHHHDHDSHDHQHHHHDSHDHVMSYTYYFSRPVNSEAFERFISELPRDVYRAKGILTFSDTNSRFLFQYAYRETDFTKITPQGELPDVVVFIGEHFHKLGLEQQLQALENEEHG
ncbi:GTP-binding protein [Paenibacillus sp. FSL M8-0334]|uniref:CobW family GTP-binding protein n=1 Tax=Paenibacillus sp. FSL M8-0334 TaxID=2921623 RepID=UPI0030F73F6A